MRQGRLAIRRNFFSNRVVSSWNDNPVLFKTKSFRANQVPDLAFDMAKNFRVHPKLNPHSAGVCSDSA
jgi:hypothetical protein